VDARDLSGASVDDELDASVPIVANDPGAHGGASACEAAAASRRVLDAYYQQARVKGDVRRSELIGDLTPGGSYPGWRSVDKRLALACA
jgi:hypothetical protein